MPAGDTGTSPDDFLGILYFFLTGVSAIGVEWIRKKVFEKKKLDYDDDEDCDCSRCIRARECGDHH